MTPVHLALLGTIKTEYPAVAAAVLGSSPAEAGAMLRRHLPAASGPQQSEADPAEQLAVALGIDAGLDEPDCFLPVTLTPADEDRWDALSAGVANRTP